MAVGGLTGVTAISAADKSTCALLRAGTITCWGNNAYGQLGNGTRIGSLVPVAVKGLSGATTISARGTTACVRLNTGRAMCWGEILGNGTGTSSSVPVAVTGLSGVLAVAAGSYENACALLNTGRAKCWGQNNEGELGNGTLVGSGVPVSVTGLNGVTAVSVGDYSACALLNTGRAKCWGDNAFGEVGHGTTAGATGPCSLGLRTCYPNPVAVVGLSSATAISAGKFHACALISGGTVKCWGDNEAAQLGNGTNSGPDTCAAGFACNPAPGAVTGLTGATAVGAGGFQTCALVGGTVECWGLNHFGELGDGTTTSSGVPVAVVEL